ncbi:translation initiation factor if-2 [Phaffia rhodozyma]|uniref:Translation initiation factor IF-2, mitochondrial n=1 Tax=Phaffia rhodozyma TaxID=264483 RepID=A0A0F7SS37_PHARH|nr:translation initiation factor if-2 [Phaffia rhodozyma]
MWQYPSYYLQTKPGRSVLPSFTISEESPRTTSSVTSCSSAPNRLLGSKNSLSAELWRSNTYSRSPGGYSVRSASSKNGSGGFGSFNNRGGNNGGNTRGGTEGGFGMPGRPSPDAWSSLVSTNKKPAFSAFNSVASWSNANSGAEDKDRKVGGNRGSGMKGKRQGSFSAPPAASDLPPKPSPTPSHSNQPSNQTQNVPRSGSSSPRPQSVPSTDRSSTGKGKGSNNNQSQNQTQKQNRPSSSQPKPRPGLQKKTPSDSNKTNSNSHRKQRVPRGDVYLPYSISVANLSKLVGCSLRRLQYVIKDAGLPHADPTHLISADDASLVVYELGFNPVVDAEKSFDIYPEPAPEDPSSLPLRPPIVTIMGHVDHGKTTLLDTLRKAAVAKGEAGGITQHIGAFSVPIASSTPGEAPRTICFLDTPGHAAFKAMRARGAGVTDIVVLVVAADDGVMPQTREVIQLVKNSPNVQLVVAINKVDKHGANIERIKNELSANNVYLEDFGGDVPAVEVSGMTGQGLDYLMETVSTIAEVAELRAEVDARAEGVILESQVDRGRGTVATVLITRGTLKAGSILVAGQTWCKVRQPQDDKGKPIKKATPGTPLSCSGWKDLPSAGDEVLEASGEEAAKKAVANRIREIQLQAQIRDIDVINDQRRKASEEHMVESQRKKDLKAARRVAFMTGEKMPTPEWMVKDEGKEDEIKGPKELRLVVKGDVSGTVEAVVSTLESIGNAEAKVRIISSGVGDVTPGDVSMAQTVGATIVGFSVKCDRQTANQAAVSSVPVYLEGVIYRLVEEVVSRCSDLLTPIIEVKVLGEALCQQIFEITLPNRTVSKIAGCRVNNGLVSKGEKMRVLRKGEEVFVGPILTLKQVKKDVTEIRKGSECGIQLVGFQDLEEGDVLQSVQILEKKRSL